MSWEAAIHSQQQSDEIIRLRGELERACNRIQQLETRAAENDPQFYEKESLDSSSPYFWTMNVSN